MCILCLGFQPGEGPISKGLLRDCEILANLSLQLYCLPGGDGNGDGDDCSRHIVTLSAFLHPRSPRSPLPASRPAVVNPIKIPVFAALGLNDDESPGNTAVLSPLQL